MEYLEEEKIWNPTVNFHRIESNRVKKSNPEGKYCYTNVRATRAHKKIRPFSFFFAFGGLRTSDFAAGNDGKKIKSGKERRKTEKREGK